MNNLNRYEGYMGASMKTITTSSGTYTKAFNAPGIWSIHDNKNCILASAAKNNNIEFASTGATNGHILSSNYMLMRYPKASCGKLMTGAKRITQQ